MNNRPTNEINTLSLHDALPISQRCRLRLLRRLRWGKLLRGRVRRQARALLQRRAGRWPTGRQPSQLRVGRSEEHTSELQSRGHLVCRLLLEKKKEVRSGMETHQ